MRTGLVMVAVLAGLAGCGRKSVSPTQLVVFAPCGMELPFMALEETFEKSHPGVDVTTVLDSAHILAQRIIEKGEHADLVVSPGGVETDLLQEKGFLTADDTDIFGQYELMLFVPRANPGGVTTMADLTKDTVKTIAVADPETTSVGRYTREALKAAGLWDQIQKKIIFTSSPSIAYKHVAREKADASFAYRSCPLKTAPEKLEYSKVRVVEPVPAGSYGPAYATVGVIAQSPNRPLAKEYVALLTGEEGQSIFTKFDLPSLKSCAK